MDVGLISSKSITDINKIVENFANVYEKSKEKENMELLDSMYDIVKKKVRYEDLNCEDRVVLSKFVESDSDIYQRIIMRLLLDMHNTFLSEMNEEDDVEIEIEKDRCKIVYNPVPNIFLNILDNITMKSEDKGSRMQPLVPLVPLASAGKPLVPLVPLASAGKPLVPLASAGKPLVPLVSTGKPSVPLVPLVYVEQREKLDEEMNDNSMAIDEYMTERQLLKRKLFLFYRKYAPHRLKKNGVNINKIADKYDNNERLLNERLMNIYGANLSTMNKVTYKISDAQVFMDKFMKYL